MLEKVLILGDAHDTPELDKKRFELAGRYILHTKPDHVGLIGDFLTIDSCNSHDKNHTSRGKRKSSIIQDLSSGKSAMEALMRPIVEYNDRRVSYKMGKYNPNRFITLGNHEHRFERFINENPELDGMYETMLMPIFTQWGFKVIPFGKYHKINDMYYTHIPHNKAGKPYSGATMPRQIALNGTFNVTHGHRHELNEHVEPMISAGDTPRGISVICTGAFMPIDYVEPYADKSQNCWSSCLTEQTFLEGKYIGTKRIHLKELEHAYSDR